MPVYQIPPSTCFRTPPTRDPTGCSAWAATCIPTDCSWRTAWGSSPGTARICPSSGTRPTLATCCSPASCTWGAAWPSACAGGTTRSAWTRPSRRWSRACGEVPQTRPGRHLDHRGDGGRATAGLHRARLRPQRGGLARWGARRRPVRRRGGWAVRRGVHVREGLGCLQGSLCHGLVPVLAERWGFALIDCQMETPHLARFGARNIARADYLGALQMLLERPDHLGPWRFDD